MLQVGVDCVEIARFRRLRFDRNKGFYKRIFTPREIEYCTAFHDPYPRFAVRFAAKEATVKALNRLAKPYYTEIEVKKEKGLQPKIRINKNKFKKVSRLAISLSLTHSDSYAIAFVIVTDNKKIIRETAKALKKGAVLCKKGKRRTRSIQF